MDHDVAGPGLQEADWALWNEIASDPGQELLSEAEVRAYYVKKDLEAARAKADEGG